MNVFAIIFYRLIPFKWSKIVGSGQTINLLPLIGIQGLEFCMILEIIHGLAVSALRFELTSPFHDCRSDDQVIGIKVSPSLRNLYVF